MQAAATKQYRSTSTPLLNSSDVEPDHTKPECPIHVYSYWGSPLDSVGEDGDFVLEEISGSLIGPKANGKWPEDLIRIEGPVVGKRGCFPRWRTPEKHLSTLEKLWAAFSNTLRRFLWLGGRVKPYSA
jgi:hypothetical protein